MSAFADIAVHPYAQALTWALVHFIWQGAALGLLAYAVLKFAPLSAAGRYLAGVAVLAAMLAAPLATSVWLLDGGGIVAPQIGAVTEVPVKNAGFVVTSTPVAVVPLADEQIEIVPAQKTRFNLLALVLPIWFAGVFVLSVRLFGGWVVARRLARRALRPVTADIQIVARRVAAHLALDRVVQIFESTAVSVPVMMGWLRPIVLLPTAAIGGLSPMQLEALIAHELAHVRRHDYLVNLLQSIVETLLFYHPAVWWVSKRVRAEREHCCDDLAVEVCDRVVYVSALADLAAMTGSRGVALAATDGTLVSRVRRLLGRSPDGDGIRAGWLPAFVVVFAVGAWMPAGFVRADARDRQAAAVAPTAPVVPTAPVQIPVEVPMAVSEPVTAPVAIEITAAVRPVLMPPTPIEIAAPQMTVASTLPVAVLAPAVQVAEIEQLKKKFEVLRLLEVKKELAELEQKLTTMAKEDQKKVIEVETMKLIDEVEKKLLAFEQIKLVDEVMREKAAKEQARSSGNFIWNDNNEKIEMKWTGAFRLSDDDRDIEWVEPGKTVRISDGGWLVTTGVEVKGTESGVERSFFKTSFKAQYEPEGREYLARMLDKIIRRGGLGGAERVKKLLAKGGVPAVQAEIDRLEGNYARRAYYTALMDQATLTSAELVDLVARAGRTIRGDHDLSTTLARAAAQKAADDAVREAIINATRTIGGDHEQRRALMAATIAPLSERMAMAGIDASHLLNSGFDRSTYLIALARAGGVNEATRQAYAAAAAEIRSELERNRALQAGGLPIEGSLLAESTRKRLLLNRGRLDPQTGLPLVVKPRASSSSGLVVDLPREVEAAKTSSEKADLLVKYVGSTRYTSATSTRVFELTAGLSSSSDQRRVLEAVLNRGPMSSSTLTSFLKTVPSLSSESDRVALLLAVAKGQQITSLARSAYLSAAETIKTEADQTRVLAELVRNERRGR